MAERQHYSFAASTKVDENSGNCFENWDGSKVRNGRDQQPDHVVRQVKDSCFPGKFATTTMRVHQNNAETLASMVALTHLFVILRNCCKVENSPPENRMHAGFFEFVMCAHKQRQALINFA